MQACRLPAISDDLLNHLVGIRDMQAAFDQRTRMMKQTLQPLADTCMRLPASTSRKKQAVQVCTLPVCGVLFVTASKAAGLVCCQASETRNQSSSIQNGMMTAGTAYLAPSVL
jgi:predicted RNA-binding Zn ribbon-like protein